MFKAESGPRAESQNRETKNENFTTSEKQEEGVDKNKEKIEVFKNTMIDIFKNRDFDVAEYDGKELDLMHNEALINQARQENFWGTSDISGEYNGQELEVRSQSISDFLDTWSELDLKVFTGSKKQMEQWADQQKKANKFREMLKQMSSEDKMFMAKHNIVSEKNPKFEKTKEFKEAWNYVVSENIGAAYTNQYGQRNMERIKKSIEKGDYEELLETYKNRKGPQFEEIKAFKEAWEYLAKKYPQISREDMQKLVGREYMTAKENDSMRNELELMREKGYYGEILAMYYQDIEGESGKEEVENKDENSAKKAESRKKSEEAEKKYQEVKDQERVEYYKNQVKDEAEKKKESQQEQEKRELLALIFQEGGFRARMSMPYNRENHTSGFATIGNEKSLNTTRVSESYQVDPRDIVSRLKNVLGDKGLNEFAIVYEPLTKKEYETVSVKESSLFGLRKTTKQEERPIGDKPVLHSELVKGGKNEACVPFEYHVFSPGRNIDKKSPWQDYPKGGRYGQQLDLEVLLPKSTAEMLKKFINTDPIIVREIAEYFMKKRLKELYNGDVWEGKKPEEGSIDSSKTDYNFDNYNPLCPPWKTWDQEEGGGRIYIPTSSVAVGWKDEFVRDIKRKSNS